jgi:hypothetical protein
MVEAQVEIWDSLLKALNNPKELETVSYLLQHCGWLGEQALTTLPDIARQRREKERKESRLAGIGCVIFLLP